MNSAEKCDTASVHGEPMRLLAHNVSERRTVPHPHMLGLSHPGAHPHPAAGVLERKGPAAPRCHWRRNRLLWGKPPRESMQSHGKGSKMTIVFQKVDRLFARNGWWGLMFNNPVTPESQKSWCAS